MEVSDISDAVGCSTSDQRTGAEDPLLLPYVILENGGKAPLPGVESAFFRSGTVQAFGLGPPVEDSSAAEIQDCLYVVAREKVLADIQFQGAISDWYALRAKVAEAELQELLVRAIKDDPYGDGSNFEVAFTHAAAEAWRAFVQEQARRAAANAGVEAGKRLASTAQRLVPRPWKDQGTEAEMAALLARRHCERVVVVAQRPLGELGRPLMLSDADAEELWSSNTSECRPFKDAGYELKRVLLDSCAQAAPDARDAAVQGTCGRLVPASVQTQPCALDASEAEQAATSPGLAAFLSRVRPRWEEALLSNEVVDICANDLAALGEDEGAAAGGGGDAPTPLHDSSLVEVQAFSDLEYSRGKVVTAVHWLPHRRGAIAVAIGESGTLNDHAAGSARDAYILVWSARDAIHPEYVLECPHQVMAFAVNPGNPEMVAAGCYNGQVVVWDTSQEAELRTVSSQARGRPLGEEEPGAAQEASVPCIKHKYASPVEISHTTAVADLQWLPSIEVDKFGRVSTLLPGASTDMSARPLSGAGGASAAAACLAGSASAAAFAAAAAGGSASALECCFFVSIGGDGKVMFWDVRVERLWAKKAKRMADELEAAWRPVHVVALLSMQSMDFLGTRLSFNIGTLALGSFLAGSAEGELLQGCFTRREHDDNPDYCRRISQPHAGPIVCIARAPHMPGLLLTVGGWTFNLWQDSSAAPLFCSPYADAVYTAAAWSPSRPAVMFLGDCAGTVHVWDLLDRSHEPAMRFAAAPSPIAALAFNTGPPGGGPPAQAPTAAGGTDKQAQGGGAAAPPAASASRQQYLAVGDGTGVLRILELPRTLRRPLQHERKLFAAFVAREAARAASAAARAAARAGAAKEKEAASLKSSAPAADAQPGTAAGTSDAAAMAASVLSGASCSSRTQAAGGAGVAGSSSGAVSARGATAMAGSEAGVAAPLAAALMTPAALDQAEREYKRLEAEFKQQQGLAMTALAAA